MRELAEQAGTTVRTVHYYISEGLLPPAAGTTRNASYSMAHLARLRLIAALRDEGLALASIRQRVAPLLDDQAIEVAGELDAYLSQTDEAGFTTLGLIEAALASRNLAEPTAYEPMPGRLSRVSLDRPLRMMSESIESASVEPTRGSASDYLDRVRRKPTASEVQPAPMPRPIPPKRKPVDSERPEAWYSFQIEDGIELRVREDRYRESAGRLRAVTDTLRTTLRRYGLSNKVEDQS
ncbi:MAG TPA: helix-turn-helix domain-containing protein [Thermomicrobiales bacterium]|nr:helix-turn-helix domain-containing protein [Thermomicrobiales bacterium]